MSRRPKSSRRKFLGRFGAAAAAGAVLPCIPLLGEETARADGEYPARFVIYYTPNGTVEDAWMPSGGERTFEFSRILQPLAPFRDKLTILSGIDGECSQHGPAAHTHAGAGLGCTTGREAAVSGSRKFSKGISVDQEIAQAIGGGTPFRSIQTGTLPSAISFSGADAPLNAERDASEAADRFFDGFDPGAIDRGGASRARRRRILDAVTGDLGDIRASVAREDRNKIDAHISALEAIYGRIDDLARLAGTCAAPTLSGAERALSRAEANYVPTGEVMQRIAAAALTCDLTRVATVQWGGYGGGGVVDSVGITSGDHYHETGHSIGRDPAAKERATQAWELYATQFRTFLEYLEAVPEPTSTNPNGTLLDNTVVWWMSSMSRPSHATDNMPYVIAGGKNLGIEGGRYLQYSGVNHNQLLVSLCNVMGLTDVDQFGDPAYGTGPLPRLLG